MTCLQKSTKPRTGDGECRNDKKGIPLNCFALVSYISDPLGEFLDRLRRELVPSCVPNAHITILPPRPLGVPAGEAIAELGGHIAEVEPFQVEAGAVELFANTSVIYIGLTAGRKDFEQIHDRLNTGLLEFEEPYSFHPHITLAQDLEPGEVGGVYERAQRLWAEYGGPRHFAAETMTFVQNTDRNDWLDLAHWSLGAVPTLR